MRKFANLFLLILLCATLNAQSLQPLSKDARALRLIQQVLGVAGPAIGASSGTMTSGTIRLAGDASAYPIRIYTLGNNQSRTEIDRSDGTSVRILNAGLASFQFPNGKVLHLHPLNTLSERVMHIPSSSLMAEYLSPNVQLDYIGPTQLSGLNVVQFTASWSAAATADDQAIFLKRTKVTYSIDPLTLRILEVEFDSLRGE